MAELPSLTEASTLCDTTSLVMNAVALLPYREPTVASIEEYDKQHGGGAIPDPLLTAQRYTRFYLLGAGDFVRGLGKLLAPEHSMVTSPAVLARSAAEYSSRCDYVSAPQDSPEVRIAKALNLCRDGFNDHGVNKPNADPQLVELAKGFNDWASQRRLPKVPLPNYTDLIHRLSPEMGDANTNACQVSHTPTRSRCPAQPSPRS